MGRTDGFDLEGFDLPNGVVAELEQLLNDDDELTVSDALFETLEKSATMFSDRHHWLHSDAMYLSEQSGEAHGESSHFNRGFANMLDEVRRQRFFAPETYNPFAAPIEQRVFKKKHKHHTRWNMDNSIWNPRRKSGNSKDLFETDASLGSMFDVDWEFVRQGHGLEAIIMKFDGYGAESVENARAMVSRHARTIYGAFECYCVLFCTEKRATSLVTSIADSNLFDLTFNGYLEFTRECEVVGPNCSSGDLEVIWVKVNAVEAKTKHLDKFNHTRSFTRHEWVQALIRMAIKRHVVGAEVPMTVAEAVDTFVRHLEARLPREALQDSNEFRRKYCYVPQIEQVLVRHEGTLRALFERYSLINNHHADVLQSSKQMSNGEWITLLHDMGLIENRQVSVLRGKLIFMWSRVRGCPDNSDRAHRNLRNLFFEDFLEVRFARH